MNRVYKEEKSNYLRTFFKENHVGVVHSKFDHSLNIKLGKQLVHVSDTLEPLSAFGIKANDEKIHSLLKAVEIGDFVSCQNQVLTFYNSLNKIALVIELETLAETDLKLVPFDAHPQLIEETVFFKELMDIPVQMQTGLPMSAKTTKYLENLRHYPTYALTANEQSVIINHFLGRGIGLTPSGDDFLIGYTSLLILFNQQHEWLRRLQQLVRSGKTTDISLAYLNCLLEGGVNENIKELLDLFYSEDQQILKKKIERMRLFGHTSGTDTLLGIVTGTEAMNHTEKNSRGI
ncbi:DUF2877 domain-containing protein [Carnobacterium sp. CS13]|uniref:DUF2877 domain-containing protein n=1 Tax=Carnobacterium sp. CS13 TaxID=2800128 RepID=UPI001913E530|nr:DUF2877 domain-containing protein [Carnobacterium sp. CS13]QQP69433.1 DUF2877 domain-containing protein [Carnobacterium sp. CS13]